MPRHAVAFAKDYFKDKPIVAVEIGTDLGIHATSILNNLNIKRLYLVDPYESYEEYIQSEPGKIQNVLNKNENIATKRLQRYDNIIWKKDYSDSAAVLSSIPNDLDFVYVDGNHEYKYAKSDMELYFKKLRKGGILAGHDIVIFPGVMRAFCEFVVEHKIKFFRITKTDWYLIK